MGDVITNFLQPIARQFPMPKGAATDPEAWQRDYIEAMETHTDSLLALAAKRIIKTRDSRSFPLIAECVKACHDTLADIAEPDLTKPVKERHEEWSEERRATANRLFNCELGRQALKEDWAWTLWDWLRENERWPNKFEVEKIRNKGMALSKQFWEVAHKDKPVENRSMKCDLSQFIKMRQEKIAKLRQLVA